MKLLHPPLPEDLVTFNVRGRIFQTTLTTLRRFPDSVLYKMVQYEQQRNRTSSAESSDNEAFFIDRDPDLFAVILRYHDTEEYDGKAVSSSSIVSPKSILQEARYYNLESLETEIVLEKSYPDKYEICILLPPTWAHHSFPISEEAAKTYTNRNLDGLNEIQWNHYFVRLNDELTERNNQGEYSWTLWAVTGTGVTRDNDKYYNVILKGEKK
jgi:hypothetical protein